MQWNTWINNKYGNVKISIVYIMKKKWLKLWTMIFGDVTTVNYF